MNRTLWLLSHALEEAREDVESARDLLSWADELRNEERDKEVFIIARERALDTILIMEDINRLIVWDTFSHID